MAPLTTHLVIGERVFARLPQFDRVDYGAFLLGCVLVDANGFADIDRRTTHFAEQRATHGPNAVHRSCANFLEHLDEVLVHQWDELASAERAVVGGYLCHLAADEEWKLFTLDLQRRQGILTTNDLPVPAGVIMTAFDVLSSELYIDFSCVASALRDASVPDVFTHVPHDVFRAMWDFVRGHLTHRSSTESYLAMLRRLGVPDAEIEAERRALQTYWKDAVDFIHKYHGGIHSHIQAMVQRSLRTMPRLWKRFPVHR